MQNITFYIWLPIAIIQITLFSIFLLKLRNDKGNEETIDIIPITIYNGMAYWKNGSQLCRSKYRGDKTDMSRYEIVDILNSGIDPKDVIKILDSLENA